MLFLGSKFQRGVSAGVDLAVNEREHLSCLQSCVGRYCVYAVKVVVYLHEAMQHTVPSNPYQAHHQT